MSSAVYFKFKSSFKQYTIPFDGSAISVKDLRNAIRLSCGLKSTDFELEIHDKQGKDYSKEDDLIPKFSDLIVRRLPKANDPPKKKIANPEDMTRRDPYKAINSLPKINLYSNSINLAKSNIPDDEKLDIMTKRCSEEYSEKNYLVKPKPYGVPPASYVCNKCHQSGHWIHECPGLRDRDGKLLDFKSVKRPTGIPQDFLLEVAPGTPGAYLTKEGKYMVPIKDAEAYAMGKKEKRPFSIEENPPYIVKDEELPSKLKCLLCCKLLENPTCTPCCSSVFCVKCISDYLYDPEVNGNRQCPSCLTVIENHESLVDNELLRQLIQCWKANMLTKEIVDSCLLTTINHSSSSSNPATTNSSSTSAPNKKTELNEDSRKSPEMKFNSANDDNEISTNVEIKTEKEKVFVNNRRVLKPKMSSQGVKGDNSPGQTNDSVKLECVVGMENLDKDQDVNDLIFERVQDLEIVEIKTESVESKTESATVIAANNDKNLKIEIIAKRSDGGTKNGDRKVDTGKYRSNDHNKMSSTKNSVDCVLPQHPFSTIINPVLDTNTQLLNHFPPSSTHIVSSVQQQMMEPIQWPIINPLYNNIPLQTMFGALNSVNAVNANWLNNGLNIQTSHPINTTSRILTKDEFYERQRRLRAEKLKHRYREDNSRSPSGSQSPRRNHHKSKYDDDQYQHRHGKKSDRSTSRHKTSDGSKDTFPARKSRSSRQRDVPKSSDHKPDYSINSSSDIKTIDPKLMQDSIKTFLKYLTANPDEIVECRQEEQSRSLDESTVAAVVVAAPQHHHGTSQPSTKTSHAITGNNHKKNKVDDSTTNTSRKTDSDNYHKNKRRSTRSRSVPKVSKDRLSDGNHSRITVVPDCSRQQPCPVPTTVAKDDGPPPPLTKKRTDSHHKKRKQLVSKDDPGESLKAVKKIKLSPVNDSGIAVHKSKKSKHHKHHDPNDDGDEAARKRQKHKKHKLKLKKSKKSKKSKRDS